MMATCPECGKEFCVLYPTLYAYRRKRYPDTYYFCTYSCMRAYDRKEEATMPAKRIRLTEEQTAEAVKKYYSGGRKAALEYLSSIGSKSPAPLFESLRKRLKLTKCNIVPEIPEAVEPVQESEDLPVVTASNIETPEAAKIPEKVVHVMKDLKITNPLKYDSFTVRAIEGEFGRYFRNQIGEKDCVFFTSTSGEEISMTVEQWVKFVAELDRAFSVLGVCFDGGTD